MRQSITEPHASPLAHLSVQLGAVPRHEPHVVHQRAEHSVQAALRARRRRRLGIKLVKVPLLALLAAGGALEASAGRSVALAMSCAGEGGRWWWWWLGHSRGWEAW